MLRIARLQTSILPPTCILRLPITKSYGARLKKGVLDEINTMFVSRLRVLEDLGRRMSGQTTAGFEGCDRWRDPAGIVSTRGAAAPRRASRLTAWRAVGR